MRFVKSSFTVDSNLCLSIVDKRIPKDMELNLKNLGLQIIKSYLHPLYITLPQITVSISNHVQPRLLTSSWYSRSNFFIAFSIVAAVM